MSSSVRIMPLGDSITMGFPENIGGYRAPLSRMLANAGFPFEFVGGNDDGGSKWEGHSGWTADLIAQNVHTWLENNHPEIVLLHIGTNDILLHTPLAVEKIEQILNNIDSYETSTKKPIVVILAQIINRRDIESLSGDTTDLNKSIASKAAARIARGDRLKVANFEQALVYPEDLSDRIHPNASGYGKMAAVWFDALAPVLNNRIIPEEGFTLDILTGLAVSKKGILEMTSVVDQEYWKPLVPIGNPVFTPGAAVAMAKQTDGVLTALAVDKYGRLVVASVGGAGIWQPPVGISDTIFLPGTPVAMAKQTDGVLTALAVDKFGRLMVTSAAGLDPWQPLVGIGDTIFLPGTPVAMARQTDGVLTALAVDKSGRMVVTSVAGLGPWQRPVGIIDALFRPATPVAMAKQTDGVLTALAVDKFGRLLVTSVAGLEHWQPPVAISGAVFRAATPVAMAKQTDGVLTALAVDKFGRLVVTSVAGLEHWQPPVAISGAVFRAATPVAMSKQTDGILTALAVDYGGRLVAASVPGLGQWQPPAAISSAIFPPSAPVALAKQIDKANLREFLKAQPRFSGSPITQRIGQVTGKGSDPEYGDVPSAGHPTTVFNPTADHGVAGVDLGTNTEFQGKVVFFFGDVPTPVKANDQGDWVAYSSDRAEPLAGFTLTSVDGPDGKNFQPFSVKDIGPLGIAQTPTGAFSYPGKGSGGDPDKEQAFVFAYYNPDDPQIPPERRGSILTKSNDPTKPVDFDRVSSFSFDAGSDKFLQVAPWVIDNAQFRGLPSTGGDGLVLLGHGGPANSVHMAWMPLRKGEDPDKSEIRYYSGGTATWSRNQADAKTLFSTIGYTSLSLAWIPGARRWLLLYSLASLGAIPLNVNPAFPLQHNPNGPIVARLGITPWDWSDEITIFDPLRENALGKFMHRPMCDRLLEVLPFLPPDFDNAYGGEASYAYGPFLLNRFTKWDPASRNLTIYYLASTFRPYQIQLMRSHFDVPPGPYEWHGPVAFGDPHLAPGAPVSVFEQSPGVWAGLTVDRARAMNVVWGDFNGTDPWQGPVAFGDAHLFPGAPVSVFEQSPGVWAGLTVDQVGGGRVSRVSRMNIVWGDFNANDGWKGPKFFGDARLVPAAPVSVFEQSPRVWAGLTVDKVGAMNVVWGDFNGTDPWQGPVAFGDAHLFPGAPVSVFEQTPGVWAGLTVDRAGKMNVVWGDFNGTDPWQGPVPFGDARLFPGAHVSVFEQSPGVWAGLTVDRAGKMNVVWGDFNGTDPWQGPVPFGDARLFPGAHVSVFEQSPGVWAGLTVDTAGKMNVVWGDFNANNGWKGPVPFGDPHLFPGAPVSVFEQSPGVWGGLTVDQAGTMNVVSGDFNANDGWKGPVRFGDAHLFPGAPVSVFEQSPGVWAGLTVDRAGAMNVVWLGPS